MWADEQQRWESQRRREEEKKEDQRRETSQKKDAGAGKVEKSRFTIFFPMIWRSGWSKRRLAKAAGAEPSGQMRDEKLHAVVTQSTFQS